MCDIWLIRSGTFRSYLPGILDEFGPERLLLVDEGGTTVDGVHGGTDAEYPGDDGRQSCGGVVTHRVVILLFYFLSVDSR